MKCYSAIEREKERKGGRKEGREEGREGGSERREKGRERVKERRKSYYLDSKCEAIILKEINQTEENKYYVVSFILGI